MRRLFPIYMRVNVTEKDGQMSNRVVAHTLDALAYKCSTAYKYALKYYSEFDLWDPDPYNKGEYILPDTIRKFNHSIKTAMNPLWKMLESGLQTCKDPMTRYYRFSMTLDSFIEQYNLYCKVHFKNVHLEDLTPDIYLAVFKKFAIKPIKIRRKWKGTWVETTFLDGIGFNHMYKGIMAKMSAQYLKEYNERAVREGLPTIKDDDAYTAVSDDEGDDATENSGPIVGTEEDAAKYEDGEASLSAGRTRPTYWRQMIETINDGNADCNQMGPTDLRDLVRVSNVRFGWDVLMAVVDKMEGEPPQEFLEYLYHRKEIADERLSGDEDEEEEEDEDEDEDEDEGGSGFGPRARSTAKAKPRDMTMAGGASLLIEEPGEVLFSGDEEDPGGGSDVGAMPGTKRRDARHLGETFHLMRFTDDEDEEGEGRGKGKAGGGRGKGGGDDSSEDNSADDSDGAADLVPEGTRE